MPPMKKVVPAPDPATYLLTLVGWQKRLVVSLRTAVLEAAKLEERIKWGHLVYFSNGPVLLIRAEETRVLFGFWRGKRLVDLEPRLIPGGKFELATMALTPGGEVDPQVAKKLVKTAVALNAKLGDPTAITKPSTPRASPKKKSKAKTKVKTKPVAKAKAKTKTKKKPVR
jgi:hypothetical protein